MSHVSELLECYSVVLKLIQVLHSQKRHALSQCASNLCFFFSQHSFYYIFILIHSYSYLFFHMCLVHYYLLMSGKKHTNTAQNIKQTNLFNDDNCIYSKDFNLPSLIWRDGPGIL